MPWNVGLAGPTLGLGGPSLIFTPSNLGLAGPILGLCGPSQTFTPSNLGLADPILGLCGPSQTFTPSNLGLAGTLLGLCDPSQTFTPSNLGLPVQFWDSAGQVRLSCPRIWDSAVPLLGLCDPSQTFMPSNLGLEGLQTRLVVQVRLSYSRIWDLPRLGGLQHQHHQHHQRHQRHRRNQRHQALMSSGHVPSQTFIPYNLGLSGASPTLMTSSQGTLLNEAASGRTPGELRLLKFWTVSVLYREVLLASRVLRPQVLDLRSLKWDLHR